jgi:hypothetical protein
MLCIANLAIKFLHVRCGVTLPLHRLCVSVAFVVIFVLYLKVVKLVVLQYSVVEFFKSCEKVVDFSCRTCCNSTSQTN